MFKNRLLLAMSYYNRSLVPKAFGIRYETLIQPKVAYQPKKQHLQKLNELLLLNTSIN